MSVDADFVLRNADELVTCRSAGRGPLRGKDQGDIGIIEHGTVAARAGVIVAVGPDGEVMPRIRLMPEAVVLDAAGKTATPGLVDAHTHLIFSGAREFELDLKLKGKTYLEIQALGGGINHTVRATRGSSESDMIHDALARLDRMLLGGTTTVEAKSGYGLDVETEMRSLKAIREAALVHPVSVVATLLGAHAVPPEFKDDPDGYVGLVVEGMIPQAAHRGLARFCDVFCEKGFFTLEQSRRVLLAGKAHGLVPKIHADEMSDLGGAALAAELGAASADHLLCANRAGLAAMADAGCTAVLLPGTPFALMMKDYPDARAMIEMGLPVALGTDMNPNCYTESMPFVMSLACYSMRMTPAEALAAATINAAHAIGEGASAGSLEVGKAADITVFGAPNHMFIPYRFAANLVDTVVKRGRVVAMSGRVIGR